MPSEETLAQIAKEVSVCVNCALHESRKKSVPGEGPADAEIMFIGEGPGFHENEVIVYPNPTNGRIVLKTNVVKPNQLLMINSQGQEIKRLTLKSNNQEIDVSGISAGIYFISVIGDDRSGWIKLQIVE